MSSAAIEWLGDRALLLHLGDAIDLAVNERVHAAASRLRAARIRGVTDIVPAYASLCVHCDLSQLDESGDIDRDKFAASLERIVDAGATASNKFAVERDRALSDVEVRDRQMPEDEIREIEIPVCYGAEFGPDLVDIAAYARLDVEEVIRAHSAARYRVAMLGFAPGFPYLLGLDPRLHAPRRAQPRTRVAAGSVAIGGAQTGIYPRELPGGWQIIGRTPLALFDATRASPALLAVGQRVRFRAIDAETFASLSR